jgi:hypothetical protein
MLTCAFQNLARKLRQQAFLFLLFLAFVESHTTSNYTSGGEVAKTSHERGGRFLQNYRFACQE